MGRFGVIVPAIIAICVGCALSIGAYFIVADLVQHEHKDRFSQAAEINFDEIEKRLNRTVSVLRSITALYAASREVGRDDFRAFVHALGDQRAVQALEWIPRVPQDQRAAFEEAARENGFPDFAFTERKSQGNMVRAGARAEYFPVYFVEPHAGNEAALGFDLGSSAARLEALNRARDSGEMVASPRITLVQESGGQYGFLVFIPIYRNGAPRSTVAERRANLMGFGLGVFRIGDLIDTAIAEYSSSRNPAIIEVFDQSAPEESRRLYPKTPATVGDGELLPSYRDTRRLSVAGRDWLLVASPTATFAEETSQQWQAWAVFLTGLLFTGLVALYLKLIAGRTRHVEILVEERTVRLRKVNEELEHEVAERKRAEEKLALQAHNLIRSNEDLERFAAVASHDLQEPLRKVQAFGDRLSVKYANVLDEQGQDYIRRMRNACRRMQALIESLLSLSRVSTKGKPFVPVDLNKLVQEVISDLEVCIQDSGATVEFANLPTIDADPTQMRQLMQNLIGNALKYARSAVPPRIEISVEIVSDGAMLPNGTPAPQCRILFKDNGIGFDSHCAERIFGIFQRLHGRSEYEGTGIGLAICRKIAERHGGTITAQGQPGVGAVFTVTLPIAWTCKEQDKSLSI